MWRLVTSEPPARRPRGGRTLTARNRPQQRAWRLHSAARVALLPVRHAIGQAAGCCAEISQAQPPQPDGLHRHR